MRHAILLLLFVQCSNVLMTQTFEWVQSTSNKSLWSIGRSITHDSIGNVYVAGAFLGEMSMPGLDGSLSVKSNGGYDIYVMKLTPAGKAIWLKSIGSEKDDLKETLTRKPHIAVDKTGAFYLSCTFEDRIDFDPGSGVEMHSSVSEKDFFILKLDADGNFLWIKTIGGKGNDEVMGLETNMHDEVLLFGNYAFDADFDPGSGQKKVPGNDDIFVLCLDQEGQHLWVKTYGEPSNKEQIKDADLLPDGKMVISGTFESFISFDDTNPKSRLFSKGDQDDFLALLDSAAGLIWCQAISTKDDLSWNSRVACSSDRIYYLTSFEDSLIVGSKQITSIPEHDFSAALIQFAMNGIMTQYRIMSSPKGVQIDAMAVSSCGSVVMAGETLDTLLHLDDALYGRGIRKVRKHDYVLLHYTAFGFLANMYCFGDTNLSQHADAGYGIDIGERGEIWITGRYCGSIDFDPSKDTSALKSFTNAHPSMSSFIHKMSLCYPNQSYTSRNYVCKGDSFTFLDGHKIGNIQSSTNHEFLYINCQGCQVRNVHTINVHDDYEIEERTLCVGDSLPGGGVMTKTTVSKVIIDTNYYGCPVTKSITFNPRIVNPKIYEFGGNLIPEETSEDVRHYWKNCTEGYYFWGDEDGQLTQPSKTNSYKHFVYNYGCRDSTDCVSIDPESVVESVIEPEISVFPNPSTGQVRISHEADSYSQVDVIDPGGRVVKQQTMQSSNVVDVNLEDLSNGIYFLQLYSSVTNSASVQKIVLDQ